MPLGWSTAFNMGGALDQPALDGLADLSWFNPGTTEAVTVTGYNGASGNFFGGGDGFSGAGAVGDYAGFADGFHWSFPTYIDWSDPIWNTPQINAPDDGSDLPVEEVTVTADAPDYQITAPDITADPFAFGGTNYFYPNWDFSGSLDQPELPVEQVTVTAEQDPYTITPPDLTNFNFDFSTPFFALPASFTPYTGGTEAVTVTAPKQVPVKFNPIHPVLPAFNQANFPAPYIPGDPPPARRAAAGGGGGGGGSKASGGGGSSSNNNKTTQQSATKTIQDRLREVFQGSNNTAQNQNPYMGLTPAQLAQLLKNPNLSAQDRALANQALAAKQGGGAAGGAGAGASKPPAVPGAGFDPKSLLVPMLIAGGVFAAWKVTHSRKGTAALTRVKRSIRKAVQSAKQA